MNSHKQRRVTTSTFKGVWWDEQRKKWSAYIMKDQKKLHLGRFIREIEAALAYNIAAIRLFGKFARLNNV
jgi:hypothetical protein